MNIRFFPDRKKPWRAQWSEDGKRRSKFFPTEKAALAFRNARRKEKLEFGRMAITDEDRVLLWNIRQQAKKSGISPHELVAAGADQIAFPRKAVSLKEAHERFIADCQARNLRPKTISGYDHVLTAFRADRPKAMVSEIPRDEILAWIVTRSNNEESRKDYRSVLRNFFNWCGHPDRDWCDAAIVQRLHWRSVATDDHRIGFLTPDQTEAFLNALQPNCRAAVALACFAGIRSFERMRMQWSEWDNGRFYGIDFATRQIHIKGSWAKTRRYRLISDLPPNLWAWLYLYRQEDGPIVPMNYRNFRKACSKAAKKAGIVSMPKNAFRHSFGTHGYHRGLEWVLNTIGHISSAKTYQQSYKGQSDRQQSEDYFNIFPPLVGN